MDQNHLKTLNLNFTNLLTVFANFKEKIDSKVSSVETNKVLSKSIKIKISSENEINKSEILRKFLDKVYRGYKKNTNKSKIFVLGFVEEKLISEKINPEYTIWEEKKKMFEELKSKSSPQNELISFSDFQIPQKMIYEENFIKNIISKQLNEISKHIDTLYLRKDDKEKLMNCLIQFRNNKELLNELGLQNKLNILLYGEPGTGKSTTIQAVATYLQKDIYYIDLQKVSSNEDLQLLFEYVNKNVNSGGIVVLEDIDAMTDIVLKRKETVREYKSTELINNKKNKLSLEYLLNILQGTLTIDDSIFIVTTNHIDHLDPAFYRDGRFDIKIELKLCDHYQIKSIFSKMLKRELPNEIIKMIPENKYSPATIIYHIKNYIFDSMKHSEEIMKPFYL
jgi:ATP-dependent 26S proteasome regulatory subunit